MEDRTIICLDCGEEFLFSGEEQDFYRDKGFQDPKRCRACRDRKKAARSGRVSREMHDAICAECGEATQVPFVPHQDRPVYCWDCYSRQVRGVH
jgi:CxxC-x17-CxxC domain-containing protein